MTEPICAQASPYGVTVQTGRKYFWCACGRSAAQPFCDGSHAGTGFEPVLFQATADEEIWFCGCKKTSDRPLCDGTHNKL